MACGVADSELGQAVVLMLVRKEGVEIEDKALLNKIKKNLPNFMHPKYVEMYDALPRNPNGKVDRSKLSKEMKEKYSHE